MENKGFLNRMYQKHREMILYIFFGGCTTLVSVGSFVLLDAALHELLANGISWVLAVAFAYVTNRIWVFRSRVRGRAQLAELLSFFAGRLLTLVLEEAMLFVLVTCLSYNSTAVKLIAQVVVLVSNFFLSKLLIFRKK